jgi:hypothetical protein
VCGGVFLGRASTAGTASFLLSFFFTVSANPEKIITVNIHKVNHNRATEIAAPRHEIARFRTL